MSLEQKKYVAAAAKCNSNTLPSTVRRGSYNLQDEAMRIGQEHTRAVANIVHICRQEFHEQKLGVSMTKWKPKAILRQIATTADAYDVLRLHSGGRPVKIHDVICLGYQLSNGVFLLRSLRFHWR